MPDQEGKPKQPERESLEKYCWGEGYPTIENYSIDFCCKNETCPKRDQSVLELKSFNRFTSEMVVGVKLAPSQMQRKYKEYALIVECPECFDKFWFHITEDDAKDIKKYRNK